MRFSQPQSRAGSLAILASLVNVATAHSWVEALNLIGSNGSYVGATGYPRGFVPQSAPGFNDDKIVNLIPPNGGTNQILPTDLMCRDSQRNPVQSAGFPRLQTVPGDNIALLYEENGHVTLPWNQKIKPANRGTVYIYGTTQSSPDDTFLAIYKVWNAAGTGGDKRGKLLSTQNFDDGQCYQINGGNISTQRQAEFPIKAPSNPEGSDLWCQNNLKVPDDAPVGKPYTLYWVWDWPYLNADGSVQTNETYTTCMDLDVSSGSPGASKVVNNAAIQGIQHAAVPSYLSALNQAGVAPSSTEAPASTSVPTPGFTILPGGPSTSTTTSLLPATPTTIPASSSTTMAIITRTFTQTVVLPGPTTTAPALTLYCQYESVPSVGNSSVGNSSTVLVCDSPPQKRGQEHRANIVYVTKGLTTATRSPKPPRTVTHTTFITDTPERAGLHKRAPEPDYIGVANPGPGPAPEKSHAPIHKTEVSGTYVETHEETQALKVIVTHRKMITKRAPEHASKLITIDVIPVTVDTTAVVRSVETQPPRVVVGGHTLQGPPEPKETGLPSHKRSEISNKGSARFRFSGTG